MLKTPIVNPAPVPNSQSSAPPRHAAAPTLHGISGDRDLAEKQMSAREREIAAMKSAAEARSILGGTSDDFDLNSDDEGDDGTDNQQRSGNKRRGKSDPDARGASRLLLVGRRDARTLL